MSAELVLQEAKTRLDLLLADVNTLLAPFQPWQIALGSVLLTFTLSYLYDLLFQEEPILTRMKHGVFAFARKIPYVRNKIKSEIAGVQKGLQKSLLKLSPNKPSLSRLPSQGSSAEAIIEQLRGLMTIAPFNKRVEEFKVCLCPSAPPCPSSPSQVSGAVYAGGPEWDQYSEFLTKVYGMYLWSNTLHSSMFPDLRQLEVCVRGDLA
jgi:hypothetical protein